MGLRHLFRDAQRERVALTRRKRVAPHSCRRQQNATISSTLSEPRSRVGDTRLKFEAVCPQNGSAVVKGFTYARNPLEEVCIDTLNMFSTTPVETKKVPQIYQVFNKQQNIPTRKLRQRKSNFMPYRKPFCRNAERGAIFAVATGIWRGSHHPRQYFVGMEKQAGFGRKPPTC